MKKCVRSPQFHASATTIALARRRLRPPLVLCVAWLLLVSCQPSWAHPEGFSGLHLIIESGTASGVLTLHTRDLGLWFPPGKYPDYVASVCREIERTVDEIVELQLDGAPIPPASVRAELAEVGLIEVNLAWKLPRRAQPSELLVWSKQLRLMPRGHQQLLFIEERRGLRLKDEPAKLLLEDILTVERDAGAATVAPDKSDGQLAETSPVEMPAKDSTAENPQTGPAQSSRVPVRATADNSPRRISFFMLGVEHILTGYDHLLFLAALLLTCASLSAAAKIITCFTVAHSITLALAALDIVQLRAEIVEPAIALSIIYVALENLPKKTPALWRRAVITFAFGLIHGLGFASVLRDIGLGTIPGGVVWPLLQFNLGVEAGQLCVASIFFLLVRYVRRFETLQKNFVRTGSLLIALCGVYWLVERILPLLGVQSPD